MFNVQRFNVKYLYVMANPMGGFDVFVITPRRWVNVIVITSRRRADVSEPKSMFEVLSHTYPCE